MRPEVGSECLQRAREKMKNERYDRKDGVVKAQMDEGSGGCHGEARGMESICTFR